MMDASRGSVVHWRYGLWRVWVVLFVLVVACGVVVWWVASAADGIAIVEFWMREYGR